MPWSYHIGPIKLVERSAQCNGKWTSFLWPCEHFASWSTLMPTFASLPISAAPATGKLIPPLDSPFAYTHKHKDIVYEFSRSATRQTRWWQNDAQMAATNRSSCIPFHKTHKFHRTPCDRAHYLSLSWIETLDAEMVTWCVSNGNYLPLFTRDARTRLGERRIQLVVQHDKHPSGEHKNPSFLFRSAFEYENWKKKWTICREKDIHSECNIISIVKKINRKRRPC